MAPLMTSVGLVDEGVAVGPTGVAVAEPPTGMVTVPFPDGCTNVDVKVPVGLIYVIVVLLVGFT